MTTRLPLPATIYGKEPGGSRNPRSYGLLAAHSDFGTSAREAFERVAGSFGWRSLNNGGTHAACFSVVPVDPEGRQ